MSPETPAYQPDFTRRLVGVMFTDIVGYATKASTDEVVSFHLVQEHNKLLSDIISSYKGEIVKTIGDAVMGRFQSVVRAVECALDIQKALQEFNAGKKESEHLHLRIGVHAGDMLETSDSDLFGHDVNIAARLEPLAEPGSVIITDTVFSLIRGKTNLTFNLLGDFELKNIPAPIRLYTVTYTDKSTVLETIAEDSATPKKRVVGHYQIIEKLGEGGMGEVWLADDTTLDRKVAIKFLSEELQRDPTSIKRFLREAKSAAALDHPYICKIYQVGEEEDTAFIAMEYVQGHTLKEKLSEDPLPFREAIKTAAEIAEALEKAHQEGIIHRDLKPSNIMLTPEGHVKVMDFGLAKQIAPAGEDLSQEVTLTGSLTEEGAMLGTLAYMSPEQVRGEPLDARSDLFSFGTILYEMLTGKNPFRKEMPVGTAAAILSEDPPPITEYFPDVPELLQRVLKNILDKEPNQRYQPTSELRLDLSTLLEDVYAQRKIRVWLPISVASAVIMIIAFTLLLKTGEIGPTSLEAKPFMPTLGVFEERAAWSPTGDRIAYQSTASGGPDIWVCEADGTNPRNLTADYDWSALYPCWSPDGQRIAFISNQEGWGIYTMSTLGGDARKVTSLKDVFKGLSLTWTPENNLLVFVDYDENNFLEVYSVSSTGDNRRCLTNYLPGLGARTYGEISPSGELLAIRTILGGGCVLNLRSGEIESLTFMRSGETESLSASESGQLLRWHPSGEQLFYLKPVITLTGRIQKDLWSMSIDPRTGRQVGDPVQRTSDMDIQHYAFSPDGESIIVTRNQFAANLWLFPLDEPNKRISGPGSQLTMSGTSDVYPQWLPGSDEIVYMSNGELWKLDVSSPVPLKITPSGRPGIRPVVSPDGRWITVYTGWTEQREQQRERTGWLVRSDGSRLHVTITDSLKVLYPIWINDWSPDGKSLTVEFDSDSNMIELGIIHIDPEDGDFLGIDKLGIEQKGFFYPVFKPFWSPDGNHIAYQDYENYPYYNYPDIWIVSHDGDDPRKLTSGFIMGWFGSPNFIYFHHRAHNIYRIPIDSAGHSIGEQELWMELPVSQLLGNNLDIWGNHVVLEIRDSNTDLWLLEFPEK